MSETISAPPAILTRPSVLEWALAHYWLKERPLSLQGYRYLVDILVDETPEQAHMKAAQMAISEYMVIVALYVAAQLGLTAIYYMPTSTEVSEHVQHRVDPVIEGSPTLAAMARARTVGRFTRRNEPGSVFNVGLKRLGRGFIYFKGTHTRKNVIGKAADCIIRDELDVMDKVHAGLARERIANSDLRWIRDVSNPTFPGGPIDIRFQAGDQRRWHIRCPHCRHWQFIDWERNVVRDQGEDSSLRYVPRDPNVSHDVAMALAGDSWAEALSALRGGDLRAVCERCAKPVDRLEAEHARWVAAQPGRTIHSWQMSRVTSARVLLAEMFHDFCVAQHSTKALSQFYNMALGLPHDSGAEGLTEGALSVLAQPYDPALVEGRTVMGLDIGAVLHYHVTRWTGGVRAAVAHGIVRSFAQAVELMDRYAVEVCVVDAAPEYHAVREFRMSCAPGQIYLCNFGLKATGKSKGLDDWAKLDNVEGHVQCDRTAFLDEATADLTAIPARSIFPKRWMDDSEWVKQMCAPKRHLIESREGTRAAWDEHGLPDHYRLAEAYSCLAWHVARARDGCAQPPAVLRKSIDPPVDPWRGSLNGDGDISDDDLRAALERRGGNGKG